MNLSEWFNKGMGYEEYVGAMKVNQENVTKIYTAFQLTSEDKEFFTRLASKNYSVIALAADWCGDAMLCVPLVQRMCEVAGMKMHLLIRDDNLELMDAYLTNGTSRSIPIFIFINEEGEEVAVWGPRPKEVQQLVTDMQATLPNKEDPTFPEAQAALYKSIGHRFSTDNFIRQSVVMSVKERLTGL